MHTEADLRVLLRWCTDQDLDPLAAVGVDIERYVRWLQDVRRYQPSTVSRRPSIVVGFYRVCVIDQILAHSPADQVRRPTVPAESPTLGLGHLQFEAPHRPLASPTPPDGCCRAGRHREPDHPGTFDPRASCTWSIPRARSTDPAHDQRVRPARGGLAVQPRRAGARGRVGRGAGADAHGARPTGLAERDRPAAVGRGPAGCRVLP